MSNHERNKWVVEKESTVLTSPVLDLVRQDCRSSEDGRMHPFFLLRSRDWCNVIPVTADGKIVLVKQYRIGIAAHTLEIPGGTCDPGESDPRAVALREMTEETGYELAPGARMVDLGWTHPNPAIQDNRCHSYAVGPVVKTKSQKLDPGEMIDVVELSIDEVARQVESGEMSHALIRNAFLSLLLLGGQSAQEAGIATGDSLRARLQRFAR